MDPTFCTLHSRMRPKLKPSFLFQGARRTIPVNTSFCRDHGMIAAAELRWISSASALGGTITGAGGAQRGIKRLPRLRSIMIVHLRLSPGTLLASGLTTSRASLGCHRSQRTIFITKTPSPLASLRTGHLAETRTAHEASPSMSVRHQIPRAETFRLVDRSFGKMAIGPTASFAARGFFISDCRGEDHQADRVLSPASMTISPIDCRPPNVFSDPEEVDDLAELDWEDEDYPMGEEDGPGEELEVRDCRPDRKETAASMYELELR